MNNCVFIKQTHAPALCLEMTLSLAGHSENTHLQLDTSSNKMPCHPKPHAHSENRRKRYALQIDPDKLQRGRWPSVCEHAAQLELLKTASSIEDRVGLALHDKVAVLKDSLTGRITRTGFTVISWEVAVNALNSCPSIRGDVASTNTTKTGASGGGNQVQAVVGVASAGASQVAASAGPTSERQHYACRQSLVDRNGLRRSLDPGADGHMVDSAADLQPIRMNHDLNGIQAQVLAGKN